MGNRYADSSKQIVHPHIATVTYLSDFGAPTMVVDQMPIRPSATDVTECIRNAFVSHPRIGKHTSFDGRCARTCVGMRMFICMNACLQVMMVCTLLLAYSIDCVCVSRVL